MTGMRPTLSNPIHLLAFGFGSGLLPKAPGTFGTLAGVAIHALACQLPGPAYIALTGVLFLVGIPLCGKTAADLGVHDHPGIVWDEIVGFLVTMTLVPTGWPWVVAGFILFRLFDILKPWPIRPIDRGLGGGLGIMLDDLLAGLFAAAILHLAAYSFLVDGRLAP